MWQSVFFADTGVLLASENVTLLDRVCQMMPLWMFFVGRRCLPDDVTATDCVCQKMSLWETVFVRRCHCARLCLSTVCVCQSMSLRQTVFVRRCHCGGLCLLPTVVFCRQVCGDRGPTAGHQRRVGRVGRVDAVFTLVRRRCHAFRTSLQPSTVSWS